MYLGGHDTTFSYYSTNEPYVHAATWLTAGKVQKGYEPKRSKLPIRWLLDADGRYHKQLCIHSSDPDKNMKMAEFMGKGTYSCSGVWAQEFVDSMKYFLPASVKLEIGEPVDSIAKYVTT